MKKNTFNRVVALSSLIALMAPQFSNAGAIKGVRGSGGSGSGGSVSGGSGRVDVKPGTPVDEKVDIKEGNASVSCKQDPDASTYYPLDFFQQISREGTPLKFEIRDGNKVMVKIPASIDACGKFKPQMYQDPKSKNVTIMMVNDLGKTHGEYVKCLEENNFLKDGKVDHDKIEGKYYSEYSYTLDYDFDKEKDAQKSLKLSYGYPRALQGRDGYPSPYGKDSSVELPSTLCMDAEKIDSELVYLNKGKDAYLADLQKKCMTGNAQEIAEARKSVGNADVLKDIADQLKSKLDAAYLVAVKEDVKKIYDEMGKIENQINSNKDMDEETAKKLTRKYAELAKDLDSKFLNPAIYRLDQLMKQISDMEDGDAKTKVADEIKKLNADIYAFADRLRADKVAGPSMYALLEKYALNDSAKTIEGIRLKSYLYSKVYPGGKEDSRGKAITFEEANQKQVKGEQNFDRTLNDWADVVLVGKGNMIPIRKTERERAIAIQKMNQRYNTYQQTEYKNYYQYCGTGMTGGVKNPVQCQTFLAGVEKRRQLELKRRERDLNYIKTRNEKLDKMGISYNNYIQAQADRAQRDEDLPYGSSYSGYETTFEENYPHYDASAMMSTTTGIQNGYNPQMFNMGYQQPTMMGNNMVALGNQSYMGNQMYNGMQGQYQYQMMPPTMMR